MMCTDARTSRAALAGELFKLPTNVDDQALARAVSLLLMGHTNLEATARVSSDGPERTGGPRRD